MNDETLCCPFVNKLLHSFNFYGSDPQELDRAARSHERFSGDQSVYSHTQKKRVLEVLSRDRYFLAKVTRIHRGVKEAIWQEARLGLVPRT